MRYKIYVTDVKKNNGETYFLLDLDSYELLTEGKNRWVSVFLANIFEEMDCSDGGFINLIYNNTKEFTLKEGVDMVNNIFSHTFTVNKIVKVCEEEVYERLEISKAEIVDKVEEQMDKEPVKEKPVVTEFKGKIKVDEQSITKFPCFNDGTFILIQCKDRIFIARRKPSDKNITSSTRVCIENTLANNFFNDLEITGEKCSVYKAATPELFNSWKKILERVYNKQKQDYIRALELK